jgi:cytochrome c biogenesis factor
MKSIVRFFLSIKTAYGFFLFFVAIMLTGSLSLPNNLAFFSGIDDTPLFAWLAEAGSFGTTWWIYMLIAGLALFAVNTSFCTGEVVLFKLGRRNLIAKLSPQVMHVGVLFVMLGHLLTASLGIKLDIDLKKGETKTVTDTTAISLVDVRETVDENGYAIDWDARIKWTADGKSSDVLGLRPAHPLYLGAYGIYSKSVAVDKKETSALIRVSRDPGAVPALFGGILMTIGGVGFLYGRFSAASSSFQS